MPRGRIQSLTKEERTELAHKAFLASIAKPRHCVSCGKEFQVSTSQQKYCSKECMESFWISDARLSEGRVCSHCGVLLTGSNWPLYWRRHREAICVKCALQRKKEQYTRYAKKFRAYSNQWRKDNIVRVRANMRRLYRKERFEVLSHYGGNPPKCACCGETIYDFLSIDHIEGGGIKHRRSIGANGLPFYRSIKNEGFPPKYQVLCMNCNWGRARNKGICPHKSPKLVEAPVLAPRWVWHPYRQ